jgi:hypothetical protein
VVVLAKRDPETGRTDVLRFREGRAEIGAVEPLVEGRPIRGEVVRLHPRKELPIVCDVEVELDADELGKATASRSGPAMVANDAYRRNWDAIWAHRRDGELPS